MASSAGSRALWLLVCALAAIRQVTSAVTPEEVVGWFQDISAFSKYVRGDVERINAFNAPFIGGNVKLHLDHIIVQIEAYSSELGPANTNTFKDKDAKLVVDALKTSVQDFQKLLDAIIGKHGELIIYVGPIHDALVKLKSVMDTFAVGILNRIPSQAPAAKEQFTSLDDRLKAAIKVYSAPH